MTLSNAQPTGPDDRAGRGFWDGVWKAKRRSRVVGDRRPTFREMRYSALFARAFALLGDTRGKRLLEVGCADSAWMPWFAKQWGFRVSGLDYSAVGCERAEALGKASGVELDIVCGDMFAPPESMLGQFDVVVSMGLVEHFDDTAGAVRALSRLLKPGGVLITTVPNIAGLTGTLMKWVNRDVYDKHVPLDAAALRKAHDDAGLELVECDYLMAVNLGVVNAAELDPRKLTTKLKQALVFGFIVASRGIWVLERTIHPLPVRPSTSPYIAAIARVR